MKTGIHPPYYPTKVTCACGNTFVTGSTVETITLQICSNCHPFYTGRQKFVDTAGRVEKFQQKFGWTDGMAQGLTQGVAKTAPTRKGEKAAARTKQQELADALYEAGKKAAKKLKPIYPARVDQPIKMAEGEGQDEVAKPAKAKEKGEVKGKAKGEEKKDTGVPKEAAKDAAKTGAKTGGKKKGKAGEAAALDKAKTEA